MSGYFVVRRESIEGPDFQSAGFKLLLDLLVRARLRQVQEVSFSFGVREAGKSKASMEVAREYLRLLLRLNSFKGLAAVAPLPGSLPKQEVKAMTILRTTRPVVR